MVIRVVAQAWTLGYPAMALAGLAAVVIPVAIHLMTKLHRRPMVWAAMRFLIEAQRRHRQRLRLEQMLLLAVRCLIPMVLGLALSGPLLSGCASGGLGAVPGRLVCLVIDDSLSTQAIDETGRGRFEKLRGLAMSIVDDLTPSDRVGVWRAGRPGEAVRNLDRFDRNAVRRLIESIQPRHSRSDLVGTLELVNAELKRRDRSPEHVVVVVISDFANDALPVDRVVPPGVAELAKRAELLVVRPMPQIVNVQVSALTPQRRVVLPVAPGQIPTVPVRVHLRRFVNDGSRMTSRVQLTVFGDRTSQPIAEVTRDHRWSAGHSEAVVQVSVPLARTSDTASTQGGLVAIRARVVEQDDATVYRGGLAADDERWSVVELRTRVRVGIVDSEIGQHAGFAAGSNVFAPGDWLRIALAPSAYTSDANSGGEVIELSTVDAQSLNDQSLDELDCVFVVRPDLLTADGWGSLGRLARGGGLVWLIAPAGDGPAVWGAGLREGLGIDWQLGIEPVRVGQGDQTVRMLATDTRVPEPLALIAADWQVLLQPVRVSRYLELAGVAEESVWLKTADGDPLLAVQSLGEGSVLLLTTAIDSAWTNLPTKPLFVPLLHEAIRGVLGDPGAASDRSWTSGDALVLGDRWADAEQLVSSSAGGVEENRLRLRRTDRGVEAVTAVDQPGVYRAWPASVGQALVVNPDPHGGDTRSVDPQRLVQWLDTLGQWQWLDWTDPTRVLAKQVVTAAMAWPLLWIALGLVIAEMCLARWFSHATVPGQGWSGRLWSVLARDTLKRTD